MNLAVLPKKGAKVVVAMSGGVDSSVAAGYLKKQGYDVIGITLQLHDMSNSVENEFGSCCSLGDLYDARWVANRLEIPFYVNDMEEDFKEKVIDDFIQEYLNGRTPNPCVKCNEKVKFRQMMDWAMDLGADFLATGHYAKTRLNSTSGMTELIKGDDCDKDQSYFLFPIKQKDLAKTLFPIGEMEKKHVREMAAELGLGKLSQKPDSQEICFVQAKSYKDFIEQEVPKELLRGGNIVNVKGEVMGEHSGLHQFTVGQRKGLGIFAKDPLFVLALRSKTNELVVGAETSLFRKSATVSNINWINEPLIAEQNVQAKIRYRAKETPVRAIPMGENRVEIIFDTPQRAVTPGQALVLYDGDRVMGGGWIEDLSLQ